MASWVEHDQQRDALTRGDRPLDRGAALLSEPPARSLRLLGRTQETADVFSFHFEPDRPLAFRAGQFLHYTLPHGWPDERGDERYFTIASAPSEPGIMLTTRLPGESSSFKQALARLEPGMVVEVGEPGGRFVLAEGEPRVVFIAGGIGITPFRSMLVELAAVPAETEITLLYASRTPDIAFKPLLDSLAATNPRLEVVYTVSEPTPGWTGSVGRVDAGFIARHVPDPAAPLYYASGPQPMVRAVAQSLADLGVPRPRVKREIFPGYAES